MVTLVKFVLLSSFQVLLYVEIYLTMAVDSYSGEYYTSPPFVAENAKSSCGFVDFVKRKCEGLPGSKLKPEYRPTTAPPTLVNEKDKVIPASSFNFGAFIIALLTSLVVALSGAFACWCCRTLFARRASLLQLDNNNATIPMDPLVDPPSGSSDNRVMYLRSNSLPAYSAVVSSNKNSAIEEPPPAYSSLFAATAEGNKS